MHYKYKTKNTCSSEIEFDIDNNKIYNVRYTGGCNGNLKAVSSLVEGVDIDEFQKRCKGIKCGFRDTSCIDQLSKAIEEVTVDTKK